MELTQQVKNYHATLRINATHHKGFKDTTQDQDSHHRNLQVLSNGKPVGYDNTLKVVEHEAGKMPRLPPKQTNKHKGFIRNALGGFFTS